MTSEIKELKIPAKITSLEEYKQCIIKIGNWLDLNHVILMDFTSGYKKQCELIDAKFYFMLVALELANNIQGYQFKEMIFIYKMIFNRILNTLQQRLKALDNQLETLDKDREQK